MSQKEYIGHNSINKLKKILAKHKPNSIFLVTGKGSYVKSGAKTVIDKVLKDYNSTHFNDFETNPKLFDIKKGIKLFKKNKCDFVIGVGGGTAMDIAKSVNILASNSRKPVDFIKNNKKIKNKGLILAAIPTTSGSGSEATRFAVVYIDKTKYSLEHDFILPDYAIVDPQFTTSLPRDITAPTGMDALSQAIESYWSVHSTKVSKKYASKAIKLIIKNLSIAVNKPSKRTREAMAKAANLAGKAINITRTTACHAVSYPITSYFGVPHGHAVALTLVSMLKYNSQVTESSLLDKRGTAYAREAINEIVTLLGASDVEDASNKLENLMIEIGLNVRLSELGIKRQDISLIIKRGFNPDRVNNNPRRLSGNALRKILNEIV